MLLEDHETTYETLTPEIQKLSSDNQREKYKEYFFKAFFNFKIQRDFEEFF